MANLADLLQHSVLPFVLPFVGVGSLIVSAVVARRATRERHFAYRQHLYEQRLKFLCDDFNRLATVRKSCTDIAAALSARRANTNEQGVGFLEATKSFESAEQEIQIHNGERALFYSKEMLTRFLALEQGLTEFAKGNAQLQKLSYAAQFWAYQDLPSYFDALIAQARSELQVDKLIQDAQRMLARA